MLGTYTDGFRARAISRWRAALQEQHTVVHQQDLAHRLWSRGLKRRVFLDWV